MRGSSSARIRTASCIAMTISCHPISRDRSREQPFSRLGFRSSTDSWRSSALSRKIFPKLGTRPRQQATLYCSQTTSLTREALWHAHFLRFLGIHIETIRRLAISSLVVRPVTHAVGNILRPHHQQRRIFVPPQALERRLVPAWSFRSSGAPRPTRVIYSGPFKVK